MNSLTLFILIVVLKKTRIELLNQLFVIQRHIGFGVLLQDMFGVHPQDMQQEIREIDDAGEPC